MPRVALVLAALLATAALPALPAAADAGAAPDERAFVVAFTKLPRDHASYAGGRVTSVNEALGFLVVATRDAPGLERHARADANVRYLEPDEEVVHALLTPNDPLFAGYQYDLTSSTTNVVAAWDATLGATSVKLCVIDTGQYRAHEDLAGLTYYFWKDEVNGRSSAYDDNGHGTHVTGTAAASTNNGKGIAGIAPGASIGAAKVLNARGSGTWSQVANGITDCADAGSHVETMSLGASSGASALRDAVAYAVARGVFITAAAGNSGPCTDCVGYPAAYDGVTAVSCSDAANALCSFSSQGPQVDLLAPGKSIASAYAANKSPCRRSDGNHCYVLLSGTSMSTPHVAGVAALYLSTHPGATPAQVEAALKAGARDVGLPAVEQGAGLLQGTVV